MVSAVPPTGLTQHDVTLLEVLLWNVSERIHVVVVPLCPELTRPLGYVVARQVERDRRTNEAKLEFKPFVLNQKVSKPNDSRQKQSG